MSCLFEVSVPLFHKTCRNSTALPRPAQQLTYGVNTNILIPRLSRFICNNHATDDETDDEIFLFGFSRGAFTARSIAGLIAGVGLLTKAGLPYLAEVFKDFENRKNPKYQPANPDSPFPNKPSASDPRYEEELEKRNLTRLDIDIKVVGVFDTVGSLGIPRIPWLEKLHLQTRSTKEFLFYDTNLNNRIQNAFQALALDEHRASFSVRLEYPIRKPVNNVILSQPSVWAKPRNNVTNLRQVSVVAAHNQNHQTDTVSRIGSLAYIRILVEDILIKANPMLRWLG